MVLFDKFIKIQIHKSPYFNLNILIYIILIKTYFETKNVAGSGNIQRNMITIWSEGDAK